MSDCENSDQSMEQPMDQPADQKDNGGDEGLCTGDEFKLETAPFDSRFPNQNQTKYCYVSFLDYHRCIKARGEDYEPCQYFQRVFKSICPNAWVEKWTEQIEAGTFAGKLE